MVLVTKAASDVTLPNLLGGSEGAAQLPKASPPVSCGKSPREALQCTGLNSSIRVLTKALLLSALERTSLCWTRCYSWSVFHLPSPPTIVLVLVQAKVHHVSFLTLFTLKRPIPGVWLWLGLKPWCFKPLSHSPHSPGSSSANRMKLYAQACCSVNILGHFWLKFLFFFNFLDVFIIFDVLTTVSHVLFTDLSSSWLG